MPIQSVNSVLVFKLFGDQNETMKTDLQLGNRVKVHQNTMQTVYMKTSAISYTVEPPLTDTFQYHIESVVYVCHSATFW